MFGIGWTEFVVIALVVLLFVGPKKLPEFLQKTGSLVAQLRSASRELRAQIDAELVPLKEVHDDLQAAAIAHADEVYAQVRTEDEAGGPPGAADDTPRSSALPAPEDAPHLEDRALDAASEGDAPSPSPRAEAADEGKPA